MPVLLQTISFDDPASIGHLSNGSFHITLIVQPLDHERVVELSVINEQLTQAAISHRLESAPAAPIAPVPAHDSNRWHGPTSGPLLITENGNGDHPPARFNTVPSPGRNHRLATGPAVQNDASQPPLTNSPAVPQHEVNQGSQVSSDNGPTPVAPTVSNKKTWKRAYRIVRDVFGFASAGSQFAGLGRWSSAVFAFEITRDRSILRL